MARYECSVCGYIHETTGDGDSWDELRRYGADDIVVKGMNAGEALARKVVEGVDTSATGDTDDMEAIKIPDQAIFDRRGRDEYGPVRDLLDAGVRIFGFNGGLLHTKSAVVDREISLFGTVKDKA